ncbi:uncharacterized protein LOC135930915 [Gordionus sp. m RMFG-2023]|uniref:uncharacterized protein LOC135930915 n=1 Tax=Gordionus sp. m RMFG-2023 TaxID=3053472 RepID=UPI0031FD127D
MIKTLSPGTTVLCRQTLMNKIADNFKVMKDALIVELSDISYVCTTADSWTHNRRAYLGITGHWLDPPLKRRSVALALKRIIGCQTYDVLANKIIDIHKSFRIHNKVCKMVTDNGSNYLKAFRIFGEDNAEDEIQNDSQHVLEEEEIGVDANDINEILKEGSSTNSTMLPSHHRCSCHNLNLIATVDAEGALNDEDFKRVSRSTFYKCQTLWNKQNKSPKSSDMFKKKLLGSFISGGKKIRD